MAVERVHEPSPSHHGVFASAFQVVQGVFVQETDRPGPPIITQPDALLLLLPLLVVLSTFLFLLLLFLVCVLLIRKRRGIALGDNDGPVDMSRDDAISSDGAFDGVESRWLESSAEGTRRSYLRAKGTPCLLRGGRQSLICYTQNTRRSTLRIHFRPISPCPSSCPSKKKVFPPGRLSQTTRPSTLFSFTLARKSRFFPIPNRHHVYSLTSRSRN
jgi:hypothetical protein